MTPTELVGTVDAARILGVSRETIRRWRQRGLLPEPAATVDGHPVWRASDLRRLARRRRGEA